MYHFNGSNRTKFHFNRDLSGKVMVSYLILVDGSEKYETVYLNGRDIIEFAAEYVRLEKTEKLHGMSTEQLLGLE